MSCWRVIKRAAWITGRHRTLWPFGFLVVLIGGAAAYPSLFLQALRWSLPVGGLAPRVLRLPGGALAPALLIGLWLAAAAVASYLSEGSLVGMVDEIERSGATSVERGVRGGWARLSAVLRIALVSGLPVGIVLTQVSAPAALPLLWPSAEASAMALAVCYLWPVTALVTLPLAAGMNLPYEFMLRKCMLEGCKVRGSIREGSQMLRRHLRQAAPTWLALLGAGLVAGIALALLNLLGLFAVIRAASLVWALSRSLAAAALAALSCFLLLVLLFSFLHGLYLVFYSAAWTVAYRAVAEQEDVTVPLPGLVLLRA